MADLHVDRYAVDPLSGTRRFIGRAKPEDIGVQEATGWSTYTAVSEPHTMADCPEAAPSGDAEQATGTNQTGRDA